MSETKKLSLNQKLCLIQKELNVPKNLHNKFGNYNYRNAEAIMEACKPVCMKYQTTLLVSDSIEQIGDRFYVKATAKLLEWDSASSIDNSAYARESENKAGMDASQITGSTSSYARKYALNGIFLLDDNKDADTDEFKEESDNKAKAQKEDVAYATKAQLLVLKKKYSDEELIEVLKNKGLNALTKLTLEDASELLSARKDD